MYIPKKEELIELGFTHIKGSMWSFSDYKIVFLKVKKNYQWWHKCLDIYPESIEDIISITKK